MNNAFVVAVSGMQAQQLSLDTVANNLANLNTPGFKAGKVSFLDLMYQEPAKAGGARPATGPMAGAGVAAQSVFRDFGGGDIKPTDSQWDLAIQGPGFIEVVLPDGSPAYTRGGTLKVNKDGLLATPQGHPLKPSIAVPPHTTAIDIAADGNVRVLIAGQPSPVEIGRLELVDFANAPGLRPEGDGLYKATEASGEALFGRAGEEGFGRFAQRALEASNVKLTAEMMTLMLAQRGYELNSKVIGAADELMRITNELRR